MLDTTETIATSASTRPATVAEVVADNIRPLVRSIDEDGLYPEIGIRRLGDAGAFRHHVSERHSSGGTSGGGDGVRAAIAATAEIGDVCLSTAFCTWCQNALAWYLHKSPNTRLRERALDDVASGRQLGGTGLSNPMKAFSGIEPLALKGTRVAGGYRVTGRLPWVSNLGADHWFATVFALPDARRVMALIDCAAEGVTLASNAHFVALEGTRTFTVLLRDVFIADDDIIAEDAATFVPGIRQGFVLLQLGMALGVARGVAGLMEGDASGRAAAAWLPYPADAIRATANEIESRAAVLGATLDDPSRPAFLNVLRLRLDASWLALRSAESAMLQFGARGYLAGSEIDRRRREAQFVAIVTPSIKHITKELAAG